MHGSTKACSDVRPTKAQKANPLHVSTAREMDGRGGLDPDPPRQGWDGLAGLGWWLRLIGDDGQYADPFRGAGRLWG